MDDKEDTAPEKLPELWERIWLAEPSWRKRRSSVVVFPIPAGVTVQLLGAEEKRVRLLFDAGTNAGFNLTPGPGATGSAGWSTGGSSPNQKVFDVREYGWGFIQGPWFGFSGSALTLFIVETVEG